MAGVQENKQKTQPVLDYRILNDFVEAFTIDMDVCAQKLREWWQQGVTVSPLDLRKASLWIHVDKALWFFQTVLIKGKRYCLMQLGFRLNFAPFIMKAIIVMSQNVSIKKVTSAYIDDICQ